MIRVTLLCASAAFFSLSSVAYAQDDTAEQAADAQELVAEEALSEEPVAKVAMYEQVVAPDALTQDSAETDEDHASPVRLVEWSGDWELMKTSRRLRIWRSHVEYKLTVDAQGNVTECELVERFRRLHINQTLCEVLSTHHTFEPAVDASGAAIEGSYTDRISYAEIRARL